MSYTIDPILLTNPQTLVKFSVKIIELLLGSSVALSIMMHTASTENVESFTVVLSGDAYLNWGEDDTYIINIARQKIIDKYINKILV